MDIGGCRWWEGYSYMWVQVNRDGYKLNRWIQMDTLGYRWKQVVGGIQMDTSKYRWVPVDTYGYNWIQMDTGGGRDTDVYK